MQPLTRPFKLGIQPARIERRGVTMVAITSPHPIHDKPLRENLWVDGDGATSAFPPRPIFLAPWTDTSGSGAGAT